MKKPLYIQGHTRVPNRLNPAKALMIKNRGTIKPISAPCKLGYVPAGAWFWHNDKYYMKLNEPVVKGSQPIAVDHEGELYHSIAETYQALRVIRIQKPFA